jgi:hypothetical protein
MRVCTQPESGQRAAAGSRHDSGDAFFLALKAEALCLADRAPEAIEAIAEAELLIERFEDRHWYAELHLLRGVFLAAIAPLSQPDAKIGGPGKVCQLSAAFGQRCVAALVGCLLGVKSALRKDERLFWRSEFLKLRDRNCCVTL